MSNVNNNNVFYVGVVENRMDPLRLGRCQVRIIGMHIHDKTMLPTEDLPWAYPLGSVTSASMNGIGHSPLGPVEGTSVIVSFHDFPECQQPFIIGTIGGIPQQENVFVGTPDDEDLQTKSSTPSTNTAGQTTPIPTNSTDADNINKSNEAKDEVTTKTPNTTEIPTIPPPDFRGDKAKATAGIKALLAACDAAGLTSKEAKCAVLAIAGGESNWIPQNEGYSYSAEALQSIFKSTFGGKPDLAAKYARWSGSRESFFDFVYAPENNGRQLGNTQPGDGGKFYGRGFIQITGRTNYVRYARLTSADILNNPDSLNSDLSVSAKVTAAYVKDRTSKSVSLTDNPGYFYAVKKGIGNDAGNGAATRLKYYEYFYGAKVPESANDVDKSAGTAPPSTTQAAANGTFTPTPSAGSEIGFKDPNKKYPLKNLINEPDTHRLARGIYNGTIVPIKESKRDLGVPIALDDTTFNQPSIPYGAKYPFNHTYESESGHIQEFDDTPGYERTHRYHRTGTFEEIDSHGTRVTRIVGDNYEIIDQNGCIHIMGESNLTVDGNVNIFCRSDANIEVSGNAKMEVGGNYDIGVVGDMTVAVGGQFKLWANGEASFQSASNVHTYAGGNIFSNSEGSTNFQAGGNINADASQVWLNSGASSAATTYNLSIPVARAPVYSVIPYLQSPPLAGEAEFSFETEEDWDTPEGQKAKAAIVEKYGEKNSTNTPSQGEAAPTGGTSDTNIASCAVVANTSDFTADFKLSPNFTLGMLFDGGFNRQHTLTNQDGLTKQQIVCNLSQLANNILEKALSVLPGGIGGYGKQWKINSGFRNLGGVNASTSDHPKGRACDIGILPVGGATRKQQTFDLCKALEKILPYDQIIMEYKSSGSVWIHVGFRGGKQGDTFGGGTNRKSAFTMLDGSTYPSKGASGFHLL